MRSVLIAVLAMVASSCTFGIPTCETSECPEGTMCDPATKFCFVPDASVGGGTGGGTTTGGGSGGGTGGGLTGGGTGGGGTVTCSQSVIDSCEDWEECSATAEGGTCVDADYRLSWTAPVQLKEVKEASIAGLLTVTKGDGGTVALTSVPVSGAAAAFSGTSGLYSGMLQLSGAEGVKSFVAGWPSPGPHQELQLVRDTTPPEVSLSVELRPASLGDPEPGFVDYWKKDESAIIRVIVDGGMPAAVMNVQTAWSGTVTSTSCLTPCAGNCQCFAVDLAGAPLNAERGQVTVSVSAVKDAAENESLMQNASVNVTRFKWERTMSSPSSAALRPVSVARNGVVIWTAQNTSQSGLGTDRYAVTSTAQDGGTNWREIADGSVVAGPVLGSTSGWVATNVVADGMTDFLLSSGVLRNPLSRDCVASGSFHGDMALSALADGGEIPFAIRNGEINAASGVACRSYPLVPAPSNPNAKSSLVVLSRDGGSTEAFAAYENGDSLWKATLGNSAWTDNGSTSLPSGVQPRGLFQDGLSFVGGGGVAGNGVFFSLASDGTLPAAVGSSIFARNAGAAAVGVGYVVYGSDTGVLRRDIYMGGNLVDGGVVAVTTGLGNLQDTTPVIGEGGIIYFVNPSGVLSVRRANDLTELWRYIPAATSTAIAQPALDVYRGSNGAKDCSKPLGVYYQLLRTGSTATLRAILVDSRGLDGDAPWPKYQRDNANTGNSTLSLDPWSCP